MARAPRITYAGAHYHVTSRGNRKSDLFLCDRDRRLFLVRLAESCKESSWRCLAYCLMTNHYHLVLRTDAPDLSRGMQTLNARYAEHFNRAYTLSGHVFQGRFRAKVIEDDRYLLEAIRYVEVNPVRAGLCACASEWEWNSYGAVLGIRSHKDWFDRGAVLFLFGREPSLATTRFVEFVAAGGAARDPGKPNDRRNEGRDLAIRRAYAAGGQSIRQLAANFGVSKSTIARAVKCPTEGSDPIVGHLC